MMIWPWTSYAIISSTRGRRTFTRRIRTEWMVVGIDPEDGLFFEEIVAGPYGSERRAERNLRRLEREAAR